uniref:Uncharacterized protein n=1 Tax=Kwoniella bestiolae CBS 10118 TaxID=1296100 RepID=A0A1B9G0I7_9TREE|nr:hypothetical protein I302_05989 [Kwoniella bestiolae CBS 10118]OCF24529.1 hypothetical protein I302_05989 [Kwoniella bestiolae CBS 10118]
MTLQAILGRLRLGPTRTYPLSGSSKSKGSEGLLRLRGGCASANNVIQMPFPVFLDYDTNNSKRKKKKRKGSKGLSAGAWMGCGDLTLKDETSTMRLRGGGCCCGGNPSYYDDAPPRRRRRRKNNYVFAYSGNGSSCGGGGGGC